MTRLRWVADGLRDRVLVRLCGVLLLMSCAAGPMAAGTHPAPMRASRERHAVVMPTKRAAAKRENTHHTTARHVAQSDTEPRPAGRSKRGATPHVKEKAPAHSVARKSAQKQRSGKAGNQRLRPEEEADNEPLPQQRVIVHDRHSRAAALLKKAAIATPAPVPAKKVVTSSDFVRAAGESPEVLAQTTAPLATVAETFERGESHPDDDERLPLNRVQGASFGGRGNEVTAMVSAAPAPLPTAGKPTLPEKLETLAVKAGAAMKADAGAVKSALAKKEAARVPALPVDKAEKDAVIEAAMTPMVLPVMYKRNGRLIVPPPMKGTHEILVHQNVMADNAGLDRIQDDEDLDRMRAAHLLVALPASRSLEVNEELPVNRRYARPWTARFAADIAKNFYAKFHQALRLNSAVRTVAYQRRLQRVNGNAAGTEGEDASPHLTGQAIDFGKRGMSMMEIAWMRAYLLPLMQAGKIDVEEEFLQSCFHISVYKSYLPAVKKAAPKMEVARVMPPRRPVAKADE